MQNDEKNLKFQGDMKTYKQKELLTSAKNTEESGAILRRFSVT